MARGQKLPPSRPYKGSKKPGQNRVKGLNLSVAIKRHISVYIQITGCNYVSRSSGNLQNLLKSIFLIPQ